jgi:DNA-binding SARP family transcriptional activator/energy-coupling factor transporter ATP-binding protein EcfA2
MVKMPTLLPATVKTRLELKLLGAPELRWQGQVVTVTALKPLAMLCYLAVQSKPCARKDLAELLWSESKTGSVRVALTELRNLPGSDEWLITNDQYVSVQGDTDVKRFETALENGDYETALSLCSEATPFLSGLELRHTDPFMNWLELERSRLSELYLSALQGRSKELEKKQDYDEAIRLAKVLLEQDKLNEDVHRAVIRLEHKRGNDEAALAQFEQLRLILKKELNVEPLEETLALLRDIESGSISRSKIALLAKTPEAVTDLPEKLVGRDDLVGSIEACLHKGERVLLQGLGGSGKTALAATVAARHLTRQGLVLWLQAGDDDPDTLFDALARAFDARQNLNQTLDKAKALRDLLVKNKITLLVLDDVWNAYTLSKLSEALPEGLALLVTSRQRYPKLKRIDVGRLMRQAALELLSHHAKQDYLQFHDQVADKLCEVLGDHAFAVRMAGITLAADGLRPNQLLSRIQDAPHTLKTPPEFAEAGRESVVSLFNASLQALSDEAYEALTGFGSLFAASATSELLSRCLRRDEDSVENALSELQKRGLAERVAQAGSDLVNYQLHDLVFSFARANSSLRAITVMRACKLFLDRHQHDFNVLDAEINNVLGAVDVAKQSDSRLFIDMMHALVVGDAYFAARGHSPRSFELLRVAIAKAKEQGELETAHYFITKLGNIYREFYGDFSRALAAFQEALELARQLGNHHRAAIMLSLIGVVRFQQGASDVDEYLEEAYQLAKKHQDDLALSHVLQNKSYVFCRRKDYSRTKELCTESVKVAHRLRSNASVNQSQVDQELFFSLFNLGIAERELGHLAEALDTYRQALEIAKARNNELWTAYARQGIGMLYHISDTRDLAQENYDRALELYWRNDASTDIKNLIGIMEKEGYKVRENDLLEGRSTLQ